MGDGEQPEKRKTATQKTWTTMDKLNTEESEYQLNHQSSMRVK